MHALSAGGMSLILCLAYASDRPAPHSHWGAGNAGGGGAHAKIWIFKRAEASWWKRAKLGAARGCLLKSRLYHLGAL